LRAAAIRPDVIVGSVSDPRENAPLDAYDPAPRALVLTDGPRPIHIFRKKGSTTVDAPPAPACVVRDYGAGARFAGALPFSPARGRCIEEACRRAGPYGTAVLRGIDPLDVQMPLAAP